jgi:hypothetical protein
MDEPLTVAPGLTRLTVNLDEDDVARFEGLWPVAQGVALHAWLVRGDRAVIVDPWDAGGYGMEEIEADLATLGLSWKSIVAVAFTKPPSAEQLGRLRAVAPALEDWSVPTPGARHDLGGVVLEEKAGLWMVSPAGAVLSGDAFAGLGWIEDEVWVEDLGENEARYFEDEALRWYASRPLNPELPAEARLVAPAHGCLWKSPLAASARAQKFEDWAQGPALDEVTVVWPAGDEHGAAVEALVGGVLDAGAGLNLFRVPGDDVTALAAGARRASLLVVAEGLDVGFVAGLDKELWRPSAAAAVAALRSGVAEKYRGL